ncbi:MAG: hypothetical protein V4651_05890, partial [Bacteroidota bacterium]
MTTFSKYFLFVLVASALFFSCRKEDEFTTDASAKLSFSLDTVMFDTVFSQVGTNRPLSITKQLWVVNHNEKGVKVNIRIAGNQWGVYKINVDGQPTNAITGKEIRGKDSIVIFVQVYLSQVNSNTPFIVTDQILFETNGNQQDVDLVAFAQDAHYFNGEVLTGANGSLHWTADKPYVIYDSVLVPKGFTLTIDAGTKIHSHNASAILIAGTLVVNGTQANPVVFEGDRLDPDYRDRAGQWGSIHLLSNSIDNVITHAEIKNGIIGVRVDSLSNNQNPKLLLRNSIIKNMASVGLLGFTASITAINNAIVNCGQFTFYARFGGNYNLYHNTFAAYPFTFNRQNEQFLLDNSPLLAEDGQTITAVFPLNVVMINNIVYGSEEEEIIINDDPKGGANSLLIQQCLLRTKLTVLNGNGNIINDDPLFVNAATDEFQLKDNSPAKGKGVFVNVATDLLDKPRSTTAPTIG